MRALPAVLALVACVGVSPVGAAPRIPWESRNRYRILLSVDPGQPKRSHSPASIDLDFAEALRAMGEKGQFDEHTIEVIACDDSGRPRVYDNARKPEERCLLPWRLDRLYGISRVTLNFVVPDSTCRRFAVYFDTVDSGLGRPQRDPGVVGDGDLFHEQYQKRLIGVSKSDELCDLDGDGDLDLFKMTNEPVIYCYENVGRNHFVDRGRLTSGGELFVLPHDGSFRSWAGLRFDDWDGDGDQDLFVSFTTGDAAHQYQFYAYENLAGPRKPPTLKDRGPLQTASGHPLGSFWFASMAVADWDGDGRKDILASHLIEETLGPLKEYHQVFFYRNRGGEGWSSEFDEGVPLKADGKEIESHAPRVEVADLDGDGDLDLLCAAQSGAVNWWRNVGTRADASLTAGGLIGKSGGHAGVRVADLTGDGLLDCLIGDMWGGGPVPGRPIVHACLLKNVGTRTEPRFEEVDAEHGAPYTEGFQPCDLGRQNTVRAADWSNDGKIDLIASTCHGQVFYYRNLTGQLAPVFAPGQQIVDDAGPGALRSDICDWNNDGRKDLLVANGKGEVRLYLNEGTVAEPKLVAAPRLEANDKAIEGAVWASVLACDWDGDSRKDLIIGLAGGTTSSGEYGWPGQNDQAPSQGTGFLFYRNVGTDAAPVLTAPKWVKAGGEIISYTRPNVGSYVDWDGDGRKDFIACEFENVIWFYAGRGPTAPGAEPQLAAGIAIVKPRTVQMISGAFAIDWNRDGDMDIVTGQGHGGSGLRFFERDYIEDMLNGTRPVVAAQGSERRSDLRNDDR